MSGSLSPRLKHKAYENSPLCVHILTVTPLHKTSHQFLISSGFELLHDLIVYKIDKLTCSFGMFIKLSERAKECVVRQMFFVYVSILTLLVTNRKLVHTVGVVAGT